MRDSVFSIGREGVAKSYLPASGLRNSRLRFDGIGLNIWQFKRA